LACVTPCFGFSDLVTLRPCYRHQAINMQTPKIWTVPAKATPKEPLKQAPAAKQTPAVVAPPPSGYQWAAAETTLQMLLRKLQSAYPIIVPIGLLLCIGLAAPIPVPPSTISAPTMWLTNLLVLPLLLIKLVATQVLLVATWTVRHLAWLPLSRQARFAFPSV